MTNPVDGRDEPGHDVPKGTSVPERLSSPVPPQATAPATPLCHVPPTPLFPASAPPPQAHTRRKIGQALQFSPLMKK